MSRPDLYNYISTIPPHLDESGRHSQPEELRLLRHPQGGVRDEEGEVLLQVPPVLRHLHPQERQHCLQQVI